MRTNTAVPADSPEPVRRISTKRHPNLSVKSHRVWLDEATRERIDRLHTRIREGLGVDASSSVLIRVALAGLEKQVRNTVPVGPHAAIMIPTEGAVDLKIALLTAARGQL